MTDTPAPRRWRDGLADRTTLRLIALGSAASLVFACEPPPDVALPLTGILFDSLFTLERRITLNDSAWPMIDLEEVAVGPDGRLAIPDRRNHRVHVFDSTGRSQSGVGRMGDAPGEFQTPLGAVWAGDGSLFVVDFGSPWVTRFTPELELDTLLPLPEGRASELDRLGPHLLIGTRSRTDGAGYVVMDASGVVLRALAPTPDEVTSVPYWRSVYDETAAAAAGGERIYVASNLFYPIRVFATSGDSIGALADPPASWVQAREPELGEFIGAPMSAVSGYLETFTVILSVHAVADSFLVVSHGGFAPTSGHPFAQEPTSLDLYAVPDRRIATDIPLPGRILGTAGDRLILHDRTAPGVWSLSWWRPRALPRR